jgi:uncharacterized protein YhbP (UPF0306 family)
MILTSIQARGITGAAIREKRVTSVRVRRSVARILKKNVLCAFSTVTPDRRAHVNTAYFAYSNRLEVYFLSHPESLHCRNLARHPTMAIAVFESAQTWGERDRGLQLFGTCREARGAEARKAERAYGKRFKAYAEWNDESEEEDESEGDYRFYRFVTRRLKLFDEREFGELVFITASVDSRKEKRKTKSFSGNGSARATWSRGANRSASRRSRSSGSRGGSRPSARSNAALASSRQRRSMNSTPGA